MKKKKQKKLQKHDREMKKEQFWIDDSLEMQDQIPADAGLGDVDDKYLQELFRQAAYNNEFAGTCPRNKLGARWAAQALMDQNWAILKELDLIREELQRIAEKL